MVTPGCQQLSFSGVVDHGDTAGDRSLLDLWGKCSVATTSNKTEKGKELNFTMQLPFNLGAICIQKIIKSLHNVKYQGIQSQKILTELIKIWDDNNITRYKGSAGKKCIYCL